MKKSTSLFIRILPPVGKRRDLVLLLPPLHQEQQGLGQQIMVMIITKIQVLIMIKKMS
jgi:hypothetical protein